MEFGTPFILSTAQAEDIIKRCVTLLSVEEMQATLNETPDGRAALEEGPFRPEPYTESSPNSHFFLPNLVPHLGSF